jgi:hypothetical protein
MKVKRMSWNETEYQRDYANLLTLPCAGLQSSDRQPGFSIEIGWNEPSKLLKPFFTVLIWRWRVQIGWLNQ